MLAQKWPKTFPPLSPEQEKVRDDFMKYWHEVLPRRFGIIDRFNHSYSVRTRPATFVRTLEIGAGLGEHIAYERLTPEQEANYFALELRENMSQEIRKRFPGVRTITGDCQQRLPVEDGYFDRVLAVHVLEHLPNLPAAAREAYRVCDKARGVLSVVIPCEGSLAYTLARRVSAQRIFEKRYNQPYRWFIEREHINRPAEILGELDPYFEVVSRTFFPLRVPALFCNLVIGLTLETPEPTDMRRFCVTGAAGFIGSNLVDRLLAAGHAVVGWDNLSTGRRDFLDGARRHPAFRLVEGDLTVPAGLAEAMAGCEAVFHLAANADVRFGTEHPRKDLDQNTIATFNVLEAMRAAGVRRIAFSSTGSIYGEPDVFPTPETCPFPVQTSLYGASKLAGEGLIAAYCAGFGFQGYIFRFVSILGERYTHGHVFDFYKKLLARPDEIEVLGNGKQRKSYLYVQDCIDAMLLAMERAREPVNVYNLGNADYCNVDESLGWICDHLGLKPKRRYTGGERGWIGDSPFIFLDAAKVRALGWEPRLTIREGVIRTLDYLRANPELMG